MKHYRKELWFQIKSRRGFVNITGCAESACLSRSSASSCSTAFRLIKSETFSL